MKVACLTNAEAFTVILITIFITSDSYEACYLHAEFLPFFNFSIAQRTVVPNPSDTRDQFRGRQYFHHLGMGWDGLGMIQVHQTYHELYF